MSASNKHVLDYTGLQYFKSKIYSDLKTINGAAITGGGNLSLVVANSAITGATKCKITYDSKGLVTGGANLAASDIPSLAASKITSGTFDTARIPSLAISKITDLQTSLDAKLAAKPDGTNNLIDNNKISTKYLPDVVLGQLIFGGTVTGAGVATLSTNAKTKLGTTSSSITLTNNTTAITGYKANEGIFYVVTSDGSFASLGFKTGDWLISTGDAWRKVDNTDEVTSVQIKGTANVLSSSTATAQTGAVVTTLNLVAGHGDTVNPYGSKTANYVLAAPNGSAGAPSFRKLVAADIPSLAISKITNLQTTLDAKVAANSAITGATKCKITYDSKGLVTAGADLVASDIPTLAISKISGLQSALDAKYVKPSTGIPASDLEDTIVTSVNGSSGAITNVAKINVNNNFTSEQAISGNDCSLIEASRNDTCLILNTTKSGVTAAYIGFEVNGTVRGFLGANASNKPVFNDNIIGDHVLAYVSNVVLYNGLINTGSGSPATASKNYWTYNVSNNSIVTAYNASGNEYSFIFSKNGGGNVGTILKWGHADNYIYMLRHANNWMSDDWQKISAGHADNTSLLANSGYTTWADEAFSGEYGMVVHADYVSGFPSGYGNAIKIHGPGDTILWCDWIDGGKLFYNARRDMNSNFFGWKEVAFMNNVTKLYRHAVNMSCTINTVSMSGLLYILSTRSTAYTTYSQIANDPSVLIQEFRMSYQGPPRIITNCVVFADHLQVTAVGYVDTSYFNRGQYYPTSNESIASDSVTGL